MKKHASLSEEYPILIREWNYDKNGVLTPDSISSGSGRKVWWICDKKHEWETSIDNRTKGNGCPYCSGRYAIKGVNDLLSQNPLLADEWHPIKNGNITPETVSVFSNKKVWWLCQSGHEWEASIANRSKNKGCPFCSGRVPIIGENDFATVFPSLAEEWHPTKNGKLFPNMVTARSSQTVWWMCSEKHEWQASMVTRAKGHGCPFCNGLKAITGVNDLITLYPELEKEWHPTKNGNLKPNTLLPHTKHKAWWICDKGHIWNTAVQNRTRGAGCPYCSNVLVLEGYNDLATLLPDLAKEWHPTKNQKLRPTMVTIHSERKVWWACSNGHEWETAVCNRTNGSGCPICSNRNIKTGYNDLATVYPELAKEWHPLKNGNLTPRDVLAGGNAKRWWQCSKGHEWQALVVTRANGSGCPRCAKELQTSFPEQAIFYYVKKYYPDAVSGDKSVLENFELDIYVPSIKTAIEYDGKRWHSDIKRDNRKNRECSERGINLIRVRERGLPKLSCKCIERLDDTNEGLTAVILEVLKAINAQNISKIDLQFDYTAIISGYMIREKDNSLSTNYPDLVWEWNTEKNGSLTPEMISVGSGKKVWWKCKYGHAWQTTIGVRLRGSGCPVCANKIVVKGYNSFASLYPELAAEWHTKKNGALTPEALSAGSKKKIWWQCSKQHEWQASLNHRVNGTGCPYCSGRQAITGENDFATLFPELAVEWHAEKNGNLQPNLVTAHSGKKVWWMCQRGHEWEATVSDRAAGKGCPYCNNRIILVGFNDLETTNPRLAKEWHPTKNGDLLPSMVVAGSGKKVWWQCESGHEWQTTIVSRNNGCGCQECKRRRNKYSNKNK